MQASTGAGRSVSQPSAALARVRLWATVKAVMVHTSRRRKPTRNSSPASMLLAQPGLPDLARAGAAVVGIWLVAAAAAAFNCIVEQHIDSRMARTRWRPTAKGELAVSQTLFFSAMLCAAGSAVLYLWVNPLTMWLTFATFVGYAVVYTVVLKPLTPQNIVIGGASGAMPPVLGWAAMTGAAWVKSRRPTRCWASSTS